MMYFLIGVLIGLILKLEYKVDKFLTKGDE